AHEGTAVRVAAPEEASRLEEAARQSLEVLRLRVGEEVEEGAGPTILVAEDNEDMNRFICESLGGLYRMVPARDGAEGLRLAEQDPPDLILTDVMMPVMSGDAFVRELRSRPKFDGVPVILLTAKADDELRVRLLREGAQDYVMKPFSMEEIKARIDNLVTMKRARGPPARARDAHRGLREA